MRIDSFTPSTGNIPKNGADVISKLKPGDTIRAQVLEKSDSELMLKLSDGSAVSAASLAPIEAEEGDYVNFVFRGMDDGQLILETANKNIQPQIDSNLESIKAILTSLNLPVTDETIQIAFALQEQNQPITSDSMANMLKLTAENTDLKLNTAAFLTASNMAGDKNNIEKLQNLLAGRLKISSDISELLKLLDKGIESPNLVKSEVINNLIEKLTSNVQANKEAATGSPGIQNQASGSTQTAIQDQSPKNINQGNIPANANTPFEASQPNGAAISKPEASNTNSVTLNSQVSGKDTITASDESTLKGANTALTQGDKVLAASGSKDSLNNIYQKLSDQLKGGTQFNKEDLQLLNSIKTKLEAIIKNDALPDEEKTAAKLVDIEINNIMSRLGINKAAEEENQTAVPKLPKSFEDAVNDLKKLVITVNQKSDDINPVKLYDQLNDAVQNLKNSIQQLPVGIRETAQNIAGNLENNLNFITQLNNYSSYVQLPLSIFNHNTTGELYMLKRGSKAKKLDPSNITVLISLDSNNIGRIDTLLSIDKKNVSTNFRLENSDAFKELKDNHKMLYNSLLEIGYRLTDFTYRLIDEPINIVNFEKEAKKEFIKSPNNIDIMI